MATAGSHRGLNTIYIKHNLFHKNKLGRNVEVQNTHIFLFKSPRDVLQIETLSQQLGLGSQLKVILTRKTKQKTEELGSFSKSEKKRLNILYSKGSATYGSVQNLSKASDLSKKKVEQFLQTKTSYTKFGPPIRRFRRLELFSNISMKFSVWTWLL